MSKKILFLTGTAGTGKTSVFDEIKKKHPDYTFRASITRGFYAYKGVTNEVEYFEKLTEKERRDFQLELFDFYIDETLRFIESSANEVMTVIDRSPIDHLAYSLYSIPDLSKGEYDILIVKLDNFFKTLFDKGYEVRVYEFPYPTPWVNPNNENSDGFRYDPFGKTYIIGSLMRREISNWHDRNRIYTMFKSATIGNIENNRLFTPSERAANITESFLRM